MQRFMVELDLSELLRLSAAELRETASAFCDAVRAGSPGVHWFQSWVGADRMYCLFLAEREELVRDHARRSGAPVRAVTPLLTTIEAPFAGSDDDATSGAPRNSRPTVMQHQSPTVWRNADAALHHRARDEQAVHQPAKRVGVPAMNVVEAKR